MSLDMSKHTGIVGETQSGKTILSNFLFQKTGGCFIDIEDRGDIKAEISFNIRSSTDRFKTALRDRHTVRYVPSTDKEESMKEAQYLWKMLKGLNKNMYLYVDEIQNWGSSRKSAFDVFAVRGLKYGIHLVSISQRPAWISKTIATQTITWIFFDIGDFERSYFDNYKLPYERILGKFYKRDEIGDLIRIAPEYSFIVYRRGIKSVSEPKKLKIV